MLAALGLIVLPCALMRDASVLLLLYAAAGAFEGPVVVARSLQLQDILPPGWRATGFSMQYAAIGWGFAAGGLLLAQLVTSTGPQTIAAIAGATVALAASVSLLVPSHHRDQRISEST